GHDGDDRCGAKPSRDGQCWKDVLKLQWTVHGFDYHASYIFSTPAHQNSWGYASFNLTSNIVPSYTAACTASSSQLSSFFYGIVVYNCVLPATAPAGAAASFRFNSLTGELDIDQTVVCREKNTQASFTASGSTNLTLSCTDTKTVNQNWTIGEIYSDEEIKCAPVDVTFRPSQVV
ncbi:hypothetical protein B0T24DRAFT_503905, partial [Lasiosphaeria ovina]